MPFQYTTVSGSKVLPFTVSTKPFPSAVALVGAIAESPISTSVTVMFTVAVALGAFPSVTVNIKLSGPW